MAALLHLAVKSQHDGILGRVVIVGAAQRDARFGGNVAHGGQFKAFFLEEFQRRLVDLAARIFRARRRPLLDCLPAECKARARRYAVRRQSLPDLSKPSQLERT